MIYTPLPPQFTFKDAYPLLLTGHLVLDLYHVSFNQDLHMSHGLPQLAGCKVKYKVSGC